MLSGMLRLCRNRCQSDGARPGTGKGRTESVAVTYTLHHASEIRGIDQVEELNSVPTTVKPEEINLAQQVIATFEAPLDLSNYKDEYREGLQNIIDAKIAGQEVVAPLIAALPQVTNLMDALKKSLNAVSAAKKRPAKVAEQVAPLKRKRA
jgi:DNA end-binding protein Ku